MEERERVEPVENPETGEEVYPWTTPDGRPVDSEGYIDKPFAYPEWAPPANEEDDK